MHFSSSLWLSMGEGWQLPVVAERALKPFS